MKLKKRFKAITLVESLIYLALFGLIFLAVMQFFITLRGNNQLTLEKANLEKVNTYLNNHFSDSFLNTLYIDETNSIFTNNNGRIRIVKAGGYKEYSLNSGVLTYSDNGIIKTILDPDYKIDKLRFDKILNEDNLLQGIRIELKIVSIKNINNFKDIHTSFLLK